jgi:hypothetical protein
MKQLLSLFLFLLPCLALAQYPSNGNQKITLGEQTTADGLIWRGVAADTTLTAKNDTAAYFVLDTVNINLYTYKASATGRKWRQLGADTAAIAYVNTYGAQTVNGAKTFTSALTATRFNPTANTVTGTGMYLPAANTLGFSTNGQERMTILDAGQFLFKGGSTESLKAGVFVNDNTDFKIQASESGSVTKNITFTTSNSITSSEKMRITSGGNVGIGTTTPDFKLEVVDQVQQIVAQFSGLNTNTDNLANAGTAMRFRNLSDINGTKQSFIFADASNNQVAVLQSFNVNQTTHEGALAFLTRNSSGTISQRMYINGDGNVGIGTTSPAVEFHTTSNVRFAGLVNYDPVETDADGDIIDGGASDFNLKNSIEPINYGLNCINQLKPVSYLWNDVNRKLDSTIPDIGFIAQDVMDVIPEAVRSNGDGDLQLNYKAITATLVKAIQEQNAHIKALEQRIINLENK